MVSTEPQCEFEPELWLPSGTTLELWWQETAFTRTHKNCLPRIA